MAVWRTSLRCLGLGALAALGWLTSSYVELCSVASSSVSCSPRELAPWMQVAVRAVLVLSVPALLLLLARSTRAWLWHHPGFAVAIALPALLVTALPALIPWSRPQDGLGLPLQVPTATLGLVLGIANGVRGPRSGEGGYVSSVLTASVGFGVVLLLASAALFVTNLDTPCTGQCGGVKLVALIVPVFLALFAALTGLLAATLGYAAGVGLTHLATRTPPLSPG